MLKLIICALITLTILGFAQTPGDVVRLSKIAETSGTGSEKSRPGCVQYVCFLKSEYKPGTLKFLGFNNSSK